MKLNLFTLKRNDTLTLLDIAWFVRQLSTLISAGVPLIKSCEILQASQKKEMMYWLIYSIQKELLSGKSLGDSLNLQTQYFDDACYQLIKIGEASGKLDAVLIKLASYLEKKIALKRRFQRALFYPFIIIFFAIFVCFNMFIFVIPKFAELFQNMNVELPLITRFIFSISMTLQQNICAIVLSILSVAVVCILAIKNSYKFQISLSQLFDYFPFYKTYLQKVLLASFASNLAIMFSAGVPMTEALQIISKSYKNKHMIQSVDWLRFKVNAGSQLHQAMESIPVFPALMIQMIRVGEESGKLELMLEKIADFFESEIEMWLYYFSQILEPLIMIVLGVLIGGIVLAMYLPIFKLGSTL